MSEDLNYKERLNNIIEYAYLLFSNQVAGGSIQIDNEAAMQLHLSNILLQLGRLNIFSTDEHFNIYLEKKVELIAPTRKSKNQKARVDIWVEFVKDSIVHYSAAIELKYLKWSNTAAITDARYSVYKDLENLEHYASQVDNLITYEIICTDNHNFLENKGMKFSIAKDTLISSYTGDDKYEKIELTQHYNPIRWDRFGAYNFLKIIPKIQ